MPFGVLWRLKLNKGWECPKCGNVYAPHISQCYKCNKEETKPYLPYNDQLDKDQYNGFTNQKQYDGFNKDTIISKT